jgi:hypothetical protein
MKQNVKVISDQMGRALHYLGELNVPFALVVQGVDHIWSNSDPRHAATILRDAIELDDKVQEYILDEKAIRKTAIPPDDSVGNKV